MITGSPPAYYGETMLGDAYDLLLGRESNPTVQGRGVACVLLSVGDYRSTDEPATLRLLPAEARELAANLVLWAGFLERRERERL